MKTESLDYNNYVASRSQLMSIRTLGKSKPSVNFTDAHSSMEYSGAGNDTKGTITLLLL